MSSKTHDTPTKATAEKGVVMLDGPDGVAVTLTADAATESASAIGKAASKAHGQNVAEIERRDRLNKVDH